MKEWCVLRRLRLVLLKFFRWDGDVLILACRVLLKRWKYKILGVLLLFPVVYFLTTYKSTVITGHILSKGRRKSLHDSILHQNGGFKVKSHNAASSQEEGARRSLPAGMVKLNWVRMKQNTTEDYFTFTSAYYDNRLEVPGRPAIVIFAYVQEFVLKPYLRCVFKYTNGSKSCPKTVIAKLEKVDCLTPLYKQKNILFKTVVCSLKDGDDIPEMIQFSTTISCEEENLSGEIPVQNRDIFKELPSKRIGVCLQGSLRKAEYLDMRQDLENFISMCQYLGAEFITMYASPEEVDHRILNHLLANYSHTVNLVEWKLFDHDYHGQFGLIYDCLYRHMHKTKYVAFFDLDEMIIPFKHDNWLDMLDELEERGGEAYPGYSFMNRMYTPSNLNHPEILDKCARLDNNSVYLSWFNERQCIFKHSERSKMILSPRKIIHTLIHQVCKVVGENKDLFLVNRKFAISAHYRKSDLWFCWNSYTKNMYGWFRTLLDKYTNSICK